MNTKQKDNNLGLVRARAIQRWKHASAPKPKLRRRKRPYESRAKIARAIEDCHGNWCVLAERLECGITRIRKILERPENENLMQLFQDERLRARERCVQNLFDIANFGVRAIDRLDANKFLLSKLHPDFDSKAKVTIEGGDNPIKVQQAVVQIPAEVLDLDVDAQLKVLEAADVQEKELSSDD